MNALDDLTARARFLVRGRSRAILGITGSPGAGKSTLAEHLVRSLRLAPPDGVPEDWVAYVPMDGFHLADVELERLGRRGRKGAPDTFDAAGYVALLRRLRTETAQVVYAPAFERTLEQPIAGSIPVAPSVRLVVTEGNYLLLNDGDWADVRRQLDEVWFCELDETERVRRLVARHERFGKAPQAARAWVLDSDERNARLVELTRSRADVVVPDAVVRSLEPYDASAEPNRRRHFGEASEFGLDQPCRPSSSAGATSSSSVSPGAWPPAPPAPTSPPDS